MFMLTCFLSLEHILFHLNTRSLWILTVSLTRLPSLTVCKALVDEVEIAVDKVDPHKKVDMGSFRLDGNGNVKQNLVI